MSTTAATTTQITYRKTKAGEWVAYGPASQIAAGSSVTITKRDGSTSTRTVESVGHPFDVAGVQMVYGHLAPEARGTRAATPGYGSAHRCAECGSARGVHFARDMSGIGGWACRRCDDGFLSFC